MEKIKSFFSRFKDNRGIFGVDDVVVAIALVTVVAVAVGLNAIGEYSEGARDKVQKPYITMDKMPDPDKVDTGKEYIEGKKNLVEGYKKIAEDTVGIVSDETGVLGIIKKTGAFELPEEDEKKEQEDSGSSESDTVLVDGLKGAVEEAEEAEDLSIEEKLDENNLPTDAITQDITKIVINVANQLGSSDSEMADIVDAGIDVMKDLTNKDEDEDINDDSSETLEIVKEKLSEENKLEDEVIINKRKEHNLSVLERKQLEKENKLYEHYKDTDTIIISDEIYIKNQQRLDHLNDKIDALEKELEEHRENSEEDKENQDNEDISADEEESEEMIEDTKGAPTIRLKIVAGPTYSEADGVCYYRVKAVVTGDPYPGITFSKDSSGGAWGASTVQINLKDGGSYTLRATATNSEGSATDSIHLSWGCAVDDEEQETEDTSTGGGGGCPYS